MDMTLYPENLPMILHKKNTRIMNFIKYTQKHLSKIAIVILLSSTFFLSAAYVSDQFEISKNLDIFATVFKQLHLNYVDEINSADLIKIAIDDMLESLDPYTNYIPEDEIEDLRFMTTGQYGGIGALIQKKDDYILITDPYYGFPAQKSGLNAGDIITEVNGKSIKGLTSSDVSDLLRGQPGSVIKMKIKRYNVKDIIEKEIVREEVKIDNIPYSGIVADNIGYIKLTSFTQNAGNEVKDAFTSLKEKTQLKGVVIDLRGNGGGLLNEAVNICNIFVEKGNLVVSTKGKISEKNTKHQTLNPSVDTEIPLVLLVDRGSASASEIVAGAIQDFDRGIIIGQRTFGKGLVQNVVPLSYNAKLKVTIAKYYIPSGRCIQAINYAERNEDGSINRIPDSLKVAFKTKNGRIVYDGGGIEPDIKTEPFSYSNICISLITKNLIFDFATKFFYENEKIPAIKDFKITDNIYKDFLKFIADKDYDYTTQSEKKLKELKETAEKEKYFESVKSDYEQLNKKLIHNKDEDLVNFRKEIEFFIKNEIVSRYYFQKGRIENNFSMDSELDSAISVINDKARYNSILNPVITK